MGSGPSINEALYSYEKKKNREGGFSSGSVVKNPPANARDIGSILGPGRSHMP